MPNITKLEKGTEQVFVWLQIYSLSFYPPAFSIWERNELRPGGWAEGWHWGGNPRATMVERGAEEGVWGGNPVTSQSKAAPTLDGHGYLAEGLPTCEITFPTRPMLGRSMPLVSHCLALLSLAWEQTLSVVRAHPGLGHACQEALVWGFEVGTSGPCSDAPCRVLPHSFLPMGWGPSRANEGTHSSAGPHTHWAVPLPSSRQGLGGLGTASASAGCWPGSTGSIVSD